MLKMAAAHTNRSRAVLDPAKQRRDSQNDKEVSFALQGSLTSVVCSYRQIPTKNVGMLKVSTTH